MATNEESTQTIFQGSLYTVEERLNTFDGAHWPYDSGSCTPLKVSLQTFYHYYYSNGETNAVTELNVLGLLYRWQKQDSTFVVQNLLQIGYVVLFVITN